MYNCQINIKKILILWCVVLLWLQNDVFWVEYGFDLTDEIYGKFQEIVNWNSKDWYMSDAYSSNFSKDPFWEAMSRVEAMSSEIEIAWAQYVEDVISSNWCTMSQKQIWWILYYFVPEFRSDLARKLKTDMGDFSSRKYVLDENVLLRYCREYFACVELQWYSVWDIYTNMIKGKDKELRPISTGRPEDLKTNCQEFFQENYREWAQNQNMMQTIKKTQLWVDMYWNNSTEDSPYDIMVDLWILSQLLYEDAKEAISPVLFDIPVFSSSKDKLRESKNGWSNTSNNKDKNQTSNAGTSNGEQEYNWISDGVSLWDGQWVSETPSAEWDVSIGTRASAGDNQDSDDEDSGVSSDASYAPTPIEDDEYNVDYYDELIEWLGAYSLRDDGINGNICEEDISEPEWQTNKGVVISKNNQVSSAGWNASVAVEQLKPQELEEMVAYMLEAVNEYSSLSEEKEQEITAMAWDTSTNLPAVSQSEMQETIDKIEECVDSCKGLRKDEEATCIVRCTCWEFVSPVFDPEKHPKLWPIYIVKFCSVPSVNTSFSVWWKRIHSVEEWMNEIYGVVSKLSREWKLWTWSQQNEFLDSSTKQMKFSDSLSFTNNVDFKNTSAEGSTQSEEYIEMEMEKYNEIWQNLYNIYNPLENPSTKNTYRLIWDGSEGSNNVIRSEGGSQNWSVDEWRMESFVDMNSDADANRYSTFAEYFANWMDQQWALWTQIYNYIVDMDTYASMLYNKKCE